ncbi:MAG TPA: extracellular solute-binding protein [Oligoflexus sp.]|uniref:extracellular solute-binding protein n=1 Tax=Oligoflexus sp. TaxID=1971216 RepID=UPI002D41FC91|nr:extracellular solute-binding protein [Oligoflexus sp.]HYX32245.1 extracellular solute-binding protein [Oligoflexus sp.]
MKRMLRPRSLKIMGGLFAGAAVILALWNGGTFAYRWAFEEEQTLRIAFADDLDYGQHLAELGERIHSLHPQITLEWTRIPATRFVAADDKPEATSLEGFDFVWGSSSQVRSFAAEKLLACDVDAAVWQNTDERLRLLVANKPCALPLYYADYMVVFFNKTLLPEFPGESQQLFASLKSFRDPQQNKFGMAVGEDAYSFLSFMGGAQYFEGSRPLKALAAAFENYAQLSFFKELTPTDCPEKCLIKMFVEQRSPLLIGGERLQAGLAKELGSKLGITSLTALKAAGLPLKTPYDGRYLMPLKSSPAAKKAARDAFYEVLSETKTQEILAEIWHKVPASRSTEVGRGTSYSAEAWAGVVDSFMDLDVQERTKILRRLEPILRDFHHGRYIPRQAGIALQASLEQSE